MQNKNINNFSEIIKQIFTMKRTKITLYMVVVLWLAVATQVLVNRVFQEDFKITQAFVKTDAEGMQSSIEVVAEYETEFLSEMDKKDLIKQLANAIGLNIDKDITVWQDSTRSEYVFQKQAKQATSEIKVISIEQEEDATIKMRHYIIVRLSILQSIQSIDKYKNILEETLEKLGVVNKQITMQFEGSYEGTLSIEEKNRISTLLVEELQGEIALEYEEGDLYTVYGYTGLLKEYIVSIDRKVNIQIVITYNEITNRTKVTLATPILNQSW